jgi:hypothetical protein
MLTINRTKVECGLIFVKWKGLYENLHKVVWRGWGGIAFEDFYFFRELQYFIGYSTSIHNTS